MAVMWFGTRGYETWVKAPLEGGDHSRVGFSGTLQYLNGGASVVASQSAHKEYSWTWGNGTKRDDLRTIIDFAEGVYNSQDGTNLIYFIDPMTADRNVLPQNWATPSTGLSDGMPLFSDIDPTAAATPANGLRYPARGAVYTGGTSPIPLYIPIPPGHTLWIGAHGTAMGSAGVQVTSFAGSTQLANNTLTLLDVTDSTRCNFSIDGIPLPGALPGSYGNSGYGSGGFGEPDPVSTVTGVELSLAASGTDTLTLYGIIAQVLRTGTSPLPGAFISGQGHSGCQFNGHPTESPYSSLGDGAVGATAKLVETGAWLNG